MKMTFRQIRREIDYSQQQMANTLGVSVGTIRRIEKGDAPKLYQLAIEQVRHKYRKAKGFTD